MGWTFSQDEADLAAALFFELRNVLLEAHRQKKEGLKATRVGVITPYRQQRQCLQDTFRSLCGGFANEVCMSTLPLCGHSSCCLLADSVLCCVCCSTHQQLAARQLNGRLV